MQAETTATRQQLLPQETIPIQGVVWKLRVRFMVDVLRNPEVQRVVRFQSLKTDILVQGQGIKTMGLILELPVRGQVLHLQMETIRTH